MKRVAWLLIILLTGAYSYAQISFPNVENVYGGRIKDITGYAKTSDTTRYFLSTESANSIFYTDVHTNTSSPGPFTWHALPEADANAGFGSSVNRIEVHKPYGNVLFKNNDGVYYTSPNSGTVTTVIRGGVNQILLDGDYLYYLTGGELHFGTLDSHGNFTESSFSPLSHTFSNEQAVFFLHPTTNILYIFLSGTSPKLYKLDAPLSAATHPTAATDISPSFIISGITWTTFGIAPDGTIYVFGNKENSKYVAYSTDEITWTNYSMGISGITATNVAFSGSSSSYSIYTADVYNNNNGSPSDWKKFGDPGGFETHPNDGTVFVDPINNELVLLTTDQGIGLSADGGSTIYEIDTGIEAVQINDFDMTSSQATGWLASKSGIRRVDNFKTSPSWTFAMFPMLDGSPYYSVAIDVTDTFSVYVGNVRVYKTTDNGASWNRIFTPENSPYNFPAGGTMCNALEVCPYSPNVVFAGYEIQGTQKGGLFYSTDRGATWDQILIEASTQGEDVDVTDIIFNREGTDIVAYVSVKYDLDSPQGYSIYRLVKSGSTWTPAQDMSASGTSVGYPIVVTINDLALSVTKDTIYAAGTDAGTNEPHVYYKPLSSSGLWTPLTSDGYASNTGEATAVTVGKDTIFAAVNSDIYYFLPGVSTAWQIGYQYPVGTKINVLYYDELLVGTSIGFYSHGNHGTTGIVANSNISPNNFELKQNYPNPFNPTTTISYSIPIPMGIETSCQGVTVSLQVYNSLGQKVATLVNKEQTPGNYTVQFNASNLPSGVYFYRLRAGNFVVTKKMILLK